MRTIGWFIYFWLYLLVLLPTYFRAKGLKKRGKQAECDRIVKRVVKKWAARLLRLAGVQVEVAGLENIGEGRAVIFAANHQGNFDIPLMLAFLDQPHPLLAKAEIAKIPLIKQWMNLLNCVFIERDNARQAIGAINEVAALVQAGYSFTIFPEGTRSKGGPVGEFKGGAMKIATKTGVDVLPVVIDGSYKVMEANHNFIRPAKIKLTILPPIPTATLGREAQKMLPQLVEEQIKTVLQSKHEAE